MLLVSFSLDDVSEAFRAVLPDYLDALFQLAYIHEERGQQAMSRAPCENGTRTRNNTCVTVQPLMKQLPSCALVHCHWSFLNLRLLVLVLLAGAAGFHVIPGASGDSKPFTPVEAPKHMTLPDGFHVSLFAGEPDVVQPIAFTFDDRGRL